MRYAICNEVYGDWPFDRAFRHAKLAGYEGVEIAPFTIAKSVFDIDSATRSEVRKTAELHGLEIIGLHWLLAGTTGLHLTSPDRKVREETADYLRELARLCSDLGGRVMVFGSPNERSLVDPVTVAKGESYAVEILKDVEDALSKYEVTLALEPLGPEETNFINTAKSAVGLIERIKSPWVKLHLDVKAMSTEALTILEIISLNAKHLVHFHANDPNRQGPGMGDVDFGPIMRSLQQANYDGWTSVEVFDYEPGIDALVGGSIEYLRSLS